MSIIDKDHTSDTLGIAREIVKLWLNCEVPVSLESLVSVLRDINLGRVADVIRKSKHL